MTALILFASVVVLVFLLGFQSINVNRGHYILAALSSLGIGMCNLYILKMVPNVADPVEMGAYLIGGPVGIVVAMLAHEWIRRRKNV